MQCAFWTRVKARDAMTARDISVYSIKADYLSLPHGAQTQQVNGFGDGAYVFDSDSVKKESHQYKVDDYKLSTEDLLHYSKMATQIRSQMLDKAMKFASEDGSDTKLNALEAKHDGMSLNRGYLRGGKRKNEKPDSVK